MEKHNGNIIEQVVRKHGYSITDLAKAVKVDRRTIYNWFQEKNLRQTVIKRVGQAINHDFSKEFPELFNEGDFQKKNLTRTTSSNIRDEGFKEKYISLLEDYNRLLSM